MWVSLFEAYFAPRPRMQPSTWWGDAFRSIGIRVTLRKVVESRAAGMSCFTRWQAMWLMQHSSYWFMATDHSELAKGRTGANSFARVDDHFLTPFCGAQLFKMELYVFSTSDAVAGLNTYHEIIRSEQKFDIVPWQSTISYTRWVAERLLSL